MADIKDFLTPRRIRRLQYAFSALADSPIRICDSDGNPNLESAGDPDEWNSLLFADREHAGDAAGDSVDPETLLRIPINVNEETIACLKVSPDSILSPSGVSDDGRILKILHVMANVIGGLCRRERDLRSRVGELASLYQLAAEFAAQKDLNTLLDKVAHTVVNVLNAKACSIRLLNSDRTELQVKAVANLSAKYLGREPVKLSENEVDRLALDSQKATYTEDIRSNPRIMSPADAEAEGIISSVCLPISYRDTSEGLIRVYMGEKYTFDWFEISLLRKIASEAGAAIANTHLHEKAKKSDKQVSMAVEVQKRMMPERRWSGIPNFQIFASYTPSMESLSGDFYDFIDLPPSNLAVAVCDVAGKGIKAALLSASIRGSLRAQAVNLFEMSEVIERVNRDLCADTNINDFATMFYGVLNYDEHIFTYTNAGHPPPILIRGGQAKLLEFGGGVLGINPDAKYETNLLTVEKGDVIFVYTDGLSEAMNFKYEAFGQEKILEALLDAVGQDWSAERITQHMQWTLRNFAGLHEKLDDVTYLTIRAV